jgi:hypothetical protein
MASMAEASRVGRPLASGGYCTVRITLEVRVAPEVALIVMV